jgi:hypothetical protein
VDLRFRVRTAMSLMAREAENQTLSSLLNVVPPESPVFYALVGLIVDNTSSKDKGALKQLLAAVMQGAAPGSAADKQEQPDPVDQMRKVVDLKEVVARTRQKEVQTAKIIQDMTSGDEGKGDRDAA